jgi:hypothetical protein
MTCGEGCTEERAHELTMAASYWMQQFQKLETRIMKCGNQIDLEELQKKVQEGTQL